MKLWYRPRHRTPRSGNYQSDHMRWTDGHLTYHKAVRYGYAIIIHGLPREARHLR